MSHFVVLQFDPFCQFISLFSSPTLNLPVQLIWCCNTIWNCHKLKSWREFTFALVLLHRKSAAKSFRRSCFMRLEIIWKCNWYTQKGFIDYGVRETDWRPWRTWGRHKTWRYSAVLQLRCPVFLQLSCSPIEVFSGSPTKMFIASLLKGSQFAWGQ